MMKKLWIARVTPRDDAGVPDFCTECFAVPAYPCPYCGTGLWCGDKCRIASNHEKMCMRKLDIDAAAKSAANAAGVGAELRALAPEDRRKTALAKLRMEIECLAPDERIGGLVKLFENESDLYGDLPLDREFADLVESICGASALVQLREKSEKFRIRTDGSGLATAVVVVDARETMVTASEKIGKLQSAHGAAIGEIVIAAWTAVAEEEKEEISTAKRGDEEAPSMEPNLATRIASAILQAIRRRGAFPRLAAVRVRGLMLDPMFAPASIDMNPEEIMLPWENRLAEVEFSDCAFPIGADARAGRAFAALVLAQRVTLANELVGIGGWLAGAIACVGREFDGAWPSNLERTELSVAGFFAKEGFGDLALIAAMAGKFLRVATIDAIGIGEYAGTGALEPSLIAELAKKREPLSIETLRLRSAPENAPAALELVAPATIDVLPGALQSGSHDKFATPLDRAELSLADLATRRMPRRLVLGLLDERALRTFRDLVTASLGAAREMRGTLQEIDTTVAAGGMLGVRDLRRMKEAWFGVSVWKIAAPVDAFDDSETIAEIAEPAGDVEMTTELSQQTNPTVLALGGAGDCRAWLDSGVFSLESVTQLEVLVDCRIGELRSGDVVAALGEERIKKLSANLRDLSVIRLRPEQSLNEGYVATEAFVEAARLPFELESVKIVDLYPRPRPATAVDAIHQVIPTLSPRPTVKKIEYESWMSRDAPEIRVFNFGPLLADAFPNLKKLSVDVAGRVSASSFESPVDLPLGRRASQKQLESLFLRFSDKTLAVDAALKIASVTSSKSNLKLIEIAYDFDASGGGVPAAEDVLIKNGPIVLREMNSVGSVRPLEIQIHHTDEATSATANASRELSYALSRAGDLYVDPLFVIVYT